MSEHDWSGYTDEELQQMLLLLEQQQTNPFYGLIPQNEDQLDFSNKAQTSYGKLEDIIGSYMTRGAAGPGAWDPEAFAPTVEREYIEQPGQKTLQHYLQNPMSLEGMIASELANGGTVSMARARVAKILDPTIENHDPVMAANVMEMMGAKYDQNTDTNVADWSYFNKIASEIESGIISDPSIQGLQQDENGRYYRETSTPSAAQAWFDEQGLTNPMQQYTPEFLMGPDWASQGPTSVADFNAMAKSQALFPGAGGGAHGLDELKRMAMGFQQPGSGPPGAVGRGGEPGPLVPQPESAEEYPGGPLQQRWREQLDVNGRVLGKAWDVAGGGAGKVPWPVVSRVLQLIPGVGQTAGLGYDLYKVGEGLGGKLGDLWSGTPEDRAKWEAEQNGVPGRPASDGGNWWEKSGWNTPASAPAQPAATRPDTTAYDNAFKITRAFGAEPPPDWLHPDSANGFTDENGRWQDVTSPNWRAYLDAQEQTKLAREQRFGSDYNFNYAASLWKQRAGRTPYQDEMMKTRMAMMGLGL